MSDLRRPGRPRKANAVAPSQAALGVVRVDPDFAAEYPDGDPVAAELLGTLVRTGLAIESEISRAMVAAVGMPQSVLNSLAVIDGANAPLTPSQISQQTVVSSGTMTGTLDTLEFNGWARRLPNPDDRRSLLVEITEEGRAVANQFLPGIRKLELAIVGELSKAERATLLKLLAKVLRQAAAVAAAEPIPLDGRRNRAARLH